MNLTDLYEEELEDLYAQVGKDSMLEGTNIFLPPKSQLIIRGKLWVKENYRKILLNLCKSKEFRLLIKNRNSFSKVEFASALVDLLGAFTLGISPVLLSVILVKNGYDLACKEEDEGEAN